MKFSAFVLAMALAAPAFAQTVTLTPANPQPAASSLKKGLAVRYAYPSKLKTLADAKKGLKSAKPGPALVGLSYLDTDEGDLTMTSKSPTKVAAAISGYIRFDKAGTFNVEVVSNDGIALSIGGKQVAHHDGIHACESAGVTSVKVPSAGWYTVKATYFQRKGTACLLMDWDVEGEMLPVPDGAFRH
jgi:hypothetical protein